MPENLKYSRPKNNNRQYRIEINVVRYFVKLCSLHDGNIIAALSTPSCMTQRWPSVSSIQIKILLWQFPPLHKIHKQLLKDSHALLKM